MKFESKIFKPAFDNIWKSTLNFGVLKRLRSSLLAHRLPLKLHTHSLSVYLMPFTTNELRGYLKKKKRRRPKGDQEWNFTCEIGRRWGASQSGGGHGRARIVPLRGAGVRIHAAEGFRRAWCAAPFVGGRTIASTKRKDGRICSAASPRVRLITIIRNAHSQIRFDLVQRSAPTFILWSPKRAFLITQTTTKKVWICFTSTV